MLLAFGLGWALMAVLSTRMTSQPQRWAAVPAVVMGATGLGPPDPLPRRRRSHRGRLDLAPGDGGARGLDVRPDAPCTSTGRGRWLVTPVLVVLAVASIGATTENVLLAPRPRRLPRPGPDLRGGRPPAAPRLPRPGRPHGRALQRPRRVLRLLGQDHRPGQHHRPGSAPTTAPVRAGARTPQSPGRRRPPPRTCTSCWPRPARKAPYVLVGHSTGGPYALTYAAQYPEQVAGMVLLDSSSPEQLTGIPSYAGQYAADAARPGPAAHASPAWALSRVARRLGPPRRGGRRGPGHDLDPARLQERARRGVHDPRGLRAGPVPHHAAATVPLVVLTASETSTPGLGRRAGQARGALDQPRAPRRRRDPRGPARGRARRRRVGARHHRGPLRRPHRLPAGRRRETPADPVHPIHAPPHQRSPDVPHRPHTPSPHAEEEGHQKSWALLAVALAAQILVVLDISVVNTALPSIGRDLDLEGGDLQWLVTAYLMMSGGGLLLGGRIADLLSRRGVFLTGLALFTIASLVSGFADSGTQLIAARAVQGLSAALLTPSALVPDHDHLRRRPAQGRARHVGCRRQPRRRRRRPPRRRRHDLGQLAVHLLDQRPHRPRRPARGHRIIAKQTRDPTQPGRLRPSRRRHRHRRPRHPHLRPGRHRHPRLVVRARPSAALGVSAAPGRRPS